MKGKIIKQKFLYFKFDLIIAVIFLFSILGLIITAGKTDSINAVFFNLCVGIIVSSIFYLLNIFLPKIENFKNNLKFVQRSVNIIYMELGTMFKTILGEQDINKIRLYSVTDLSNKIKEIDPNSEFTLVEICQITNIIKKTINLSYININNHIASLIGLHDILPYTLIEILLRINAPEIRLYMSFIEGAKKENFSYNYEKHFINLFKCFIDLYIYKTAFKF